MHRVLVAAVSVVVSAVVLAGCALVPPGSPPGPEVTSPGASGLSVEPTATPAVPTETALVYFVRDSTGGLRLGREERQVPAADPVAGAVQTMLAGPVDPDYTNPWPSTAAVIAVTTSGDVTTVNLNADAWPSGLDARTMHAMADQLVWTVTEQTGADGAVALQIDGRPVGEWGDLTWSGNLRRADPFAARVLVSIDSPVDGATVASPVTISGDAAVYEAVLPWRVLDAAGAEVQTGSARTAMGQEFADYAFTVTLPPGEYTVEIREDDVGDGEGHQPDVDTRAFTVSG